jgi:hypothetical protein
MLELIKGATLALRFLLELCALGALGYWGFKTGGGALAKVGLGLGVPLVAAVVWGTFVAQGAGEGARSGTSPRRGGRLRVGHLCAIRRRKHSPGLGIGAAICGSPGPTDRIVATTIRVTSGKRCSSNFALKPSEKGF